METDSSLIEGICFVILVSGEIWMFREVTKWFIVFVLPEAPSKELIQVLFSLYFYHLPLIILRKWLHCLNGENAICLPTVISAFHHCSKKKPTKCFKGGVSLPFKGSRKPSFFFSLYGNGVFSIYVSYQKWIRSTSFYFHMAKAWSMTMIFFSCVNLTSPRTYICLSAAFRTACNSNHKTK